MEGVQDFYPLSPAQQGILFHALYSPNTRVYFQQLCFHLDGDLNIPNFERAWRELVARHPALRSSFVWEGFKEPIQVVRRQVPLPLEQHDWRGLSRAEQDERLGAFLCADREKGLPLSSAPLMRLTLIRMGDDEYRFVWSCHHILLDGWSGSVISRELLAFYEAFNRGERHAPPPARPYRDYIAWLRRQDVARTEAFWREKLKGFRAATPLITDAAAGSLPDREDGYADRQVQFSLEQTRALQALARRHHLTPNTIVEGVWALLLSYWSSQQDVTFGIVVSGRPPDLPGVESMVGLFVNTLPMRVLVTPSERLLPWLAGLQRQRIEMQRYEYCPLVDIQRWSGAPAGQNLFESIFSFENYPAGVSLETRPGELGRTIVGAFERTSYPVTFMAGLIPRLGVKILYDRRQVDAAAVARVLRGFQTLLEDILADPDRSLAELSAMTEEESSELIDGFNTPLEDF